MKRNPIKPAMSFTILCSLCSFAATLLLPLPASLAADDTMRIVAPVRLSPAPGAKLDADIAQTRQVLEKFQQAGFGCALWVVDALPASESNMAAWVEGCIKGFPSKPVIALDESLDKPFDENLLRAFLKEALPKAQAVLANHARLSNCSCFEQPVPAIQAVQTRAQLIRALAPKAPLWLWLDDCDKARAEIPRWTAQLAPLVDGYAVSRPHGWNAALSADSAARPDWAAGKPVLRAGFRYDAARVRPGTEAEAKANYRSRVARYEAWVSKQGYAGYMREIGEPKDQAHLGYVAALGEE